MGKWVQPIFFVITLIIYLQELASGKYNNFIIFRSAPLHLLHHQPLYTAYPKAYFDYFLYHPSFAVLFMPLALLPLPVALLIFLFLNTILFLRVVHLLPVSQSIRNKNIFLLAVLPEFINNQQYAQTNILLVTMLLLVYLYFEKNNLVMAALFTALAFCIKGYGGAIGLLFLLYPGKIKFICYALLCTLLLCALPLLFASFEQVTQLYTDWFSMISGAGIKETLSVIGVWGNSSRMELLLTFAAFSMLGISFAWALTHRTLLSHVLWRGLFCSYLLVWMVVFNRAAESPTYFIALTGAAYWFYLHQFKWKYSYLLWGILFVVYVLPSDLFPAVIREWIGGHYIKMYCFLLLLFYFQLKLLRFPDSPNLVVTAH